MPSAISTPRSVTSCSVCPALPRCWFTHFVTSCSGETGERVRDEGRRATRVTHGDFFLDAVSARGRVDVLAGRGVERRAVRSLVQTGAKSRVHVCLQSR